MVVRDPWYDCARDAAGVYQPNLAAQDRMGRILAETGVRWVRLEFHVPDYPAGLEEAYRCYDHFIQTVAPANDLRVLAVLGFNLMRGRDVLNPQTGIVSSTYVVDHPYGGAVNDYMREWLDRALAVSSRYGPNVHAYEVLNEQNRLPPNGDAVPPLIAARLHTKFYRFFKLVLREQEGIFGFWRDTTPILVGGLHPRGTLEPDQKGYLSDEQYLRRLYGLPADGGEPIAKEPFQEYKNTLGAGKYPLDGLAYHPYPAEIITIAGLAQLGAELGRINLRLDQVRDVLVEVGTPEMPFWITELGYDAGRPLQNEYGQAQFLAVIFRALAEREDIAGLFWFKYEDFPAGEFAPNRWGIVHIPFKLDPRCEGGACYVPNGAPQYRRPAYFTYRELAGLPVETLYLPQVVRSK